MTPWFDAECRSERRRVRAAERRYRRIRCDVDKRAWHDKRRQLRVLYERKDSQHWRAKIEENKGDMKKLWRTFRGVLGDADLDVTDDHTADDFNCHIFSRQSRRRSCLHRYDAVARCSLA